MLPSHGDKLVYQTKQIQLRHQTRRGRDAAQVSYLKQGLAGLKLKVITLTLPPGCLLRPHSKARRWR